MRTLFQRGDVDRSDRESEDADVGAERCLIGRAVLARSNEPRARHSMITLQARPLQERCGRGEVTIRGPGWFGKEFARANGVHDGIRQK